MKLNEIKAQPGATHRVKRLGRGTASGHGGTSTKGHKGQKARKSGPVGAGFEGGQTPLYRRIPKWGFKNFSRRSRFAMNAQDLELLDPKKFPEVSLETLTREKRIARGYDELVILGTGELTKAFSVKANKVSASAKEKIEKAGGKVNVIEIPKRKGKLKKKTQAS
ncbi:MAG: 50S ribosomal protein L15 [Bdellovibrionales bacterium]|nr:50S ribosomal protein L15 [Bdellovibrionales bacterium]